MAVDPARRPSRDFPSDADTPAAARHFVEEALAGIVGLDLEIAVLLTSELVTNAVVHGKGERVRVEVVAAGETVWIGVIDDNPTALPTPSERREIGGLGLPLVGRLAAEWGVDQVDGSHKCVWFQMHAQTPACN